MAIASRVVLNIARTRCQETGMEFRQMTTWPAKARDATKLKSGWRFDLSQGVWCLDLCQMEEFLKQRLLGQSFGAAVDVFIFGFEMYDAVDGTAIGSSGAMPADFSRYTPKLRQLLSVGQLDWHDVRFLDASAQLVAYKAALLRAVDNWYARKRRPRDFDVEAFRAYLLDSLAGLTTAQCAVDLSLLDLSLPEWDEDGRFIYKNLSAHDVLE